MRQSSMRVASTPGFVGYGDENREQLRLELTFNWYNASLRPRLTANGHIASGV